MLFFFGKSSQQKVKKDFVDINGNSKKNIVVCNGRVDGFYHSESFIEVFSFSEIDDKWFKDF